MVRAAEIGHSVAVPLNVTATVFHEE
jgi:hypothetical protein